MQVCYLMLEKHCFPDNTRKAIGCCCMGGCLCATGSRSCSLVVSWFWEEDGRMLYQSLIIDNSPFHSLLMLCRVLAPGRQGTPAGPACEPPQRQQQRQHPPEPEGVPGAVCSALLRGAGPHRTTERPGGPVPLRSKYGALAGADQAGRHAAVTPWGSSTAASPP